MAKESYAVVPKHRVADCRGFTGDFFFFFGGENTGVKMLMLSVELTVKLEINICQNISLK